MTGEFLIAATWFIYSVTLSILVATGGYFFAQCVFEIWRNEYAADEKGFQNQEGDGENLRL